MSWEENEFEVSTEVKFLQPTENKIEEEITAVDMGNLVSLDFNKVVIDKLPTGTIIEDDR